MLSNPHHPGEFLQEILDELNITPYRLAKATHMPQSRVTAILKGRRRITPDTALRLARYLGTTPDYWLGLQMAHDLAKCRPEDLATIEPLESA